MNHYMVFNPSTGQYTYVQTMEDAISLKNNYIIAFIKQHQNISNIVKVIKNNDGSETWIQEKMEPYNLVIQFE